MNVENHLYPTQERVMALMGDASDAPIVMLNLLKFRDKAAYADGRATTLTGREAYQIYGTAMQKVVENNGGKFLFGGQIAGLVIGEVGELWDLYALVEYPSAAAFARIATSPAVAEIGVHRAAGLAGQLLIRVAPRPF
ncbi:MAG TPA: DUF1330 domain-containing protein [Rhizomicrobium sp.]|jgi:uncharacterized protein (DUF1330 family)|nr:DUF1330 domain-containing protein [Rhizomicrobium sp.]